MLLSTWLFVPVTALAGIALAAWMRRKRPEDASNRTPGTVLSSILSLATFTVALCYVYVIWIAPQFTYLGYRYAGPPFWEVFACAAIAVLPAAVLLARRSWPPETMIVAGLVLLAVVPSAVIPVLAGSVPTATIISFTVATHGALLLAVIVSRGTRYFEPVPAMVRECRTLIAVVLMALVLVSAAYLVSRSSPGQLVATFRDIYAARAELRTELQGGSGWLVRINGLLANVGATAAITLGMLRRSRLLLAAGLAMALLVFAASGFRSVLSNVVITMLLVLLLRGGWQPGAHVLWIPAVAVFAAPLIDQLLGGGMRITSFAVRRLIATPGLISGLHQDFYSDNPKTLLGHSVLAPLTPAVYDLPPPNKVGAVYFGDASLSANTGMFTDAFSAFGLWGVLAIGLPLGLYLGLVRVAVQQGRMAEVLLYAFTPVIVTTLANSGFIVAFAGHGVLLMPLVAMLLRDPDRDVSNT